MSRDPWICDPCRRGRHDETHDRFTSTGADAGCPHALWEGPPKHRVMVAECSCRVVLPTKLNGRCPTCGRP